MGVDDFDQRIIDGVQQKLVIFNHRNPNNTQHRR
jgi:hypothetical protein